MRVSVAEPGSYKSEIMQNTASRSGGSLTRKGIEDWAKLPEPDDVAAAVELALIGPLQSFGLQRFPA